MGILELFLWLLFGRFVVVASTIKEEDAPFSQRFKEFFGDLMPFPFERNFDLTPYDTIFSSWQSQTPDFHMLAEFPPIMNVPRVQVFCDEYRLTVLVDRQSHGYLIFLFPTASWTSAAQSNVYDRGHVVNLQVSSQTRPDQQLFIQSCFVSASPEPQAKPRHSLIMNKGCAAPLGSPHPIVQFVASNRRDVVNFVLNTSYLMSQLYIHCSVLISAQETDDVVSGTSTSRSALSSPPHGIVVVSHDPVTRLTLWLPGQVYDAEQSHNIGAESDNLAVQLKESNLSDNLPVPQSSTDREFPLDATTNKINSPLSSEMSENGPHQIDSNQTRDELAQLQVATAVIPQEETNDRPIIRSKIKFAKGIDGSQTLTYEEEVKQQKERGGLRCGMNCLKRKQEPRLKGLHSIFLALLRYL
uniref:ZP domain-containing protein n=1 Tax=Echeneis naucrates TaxID=173247 RepID=A0A665UEA3_ECHNA